MSFLLSEQITTLTEQYQNTNKKTGWLKKKKKLPKLNDAIKSCHPNSIASENVFLRIKAKSRQFKLKKNLDNLFSKMYPKRMTKGSSQNRKEMIKDWILEC